MMVSCMILNHSTITSITKCKMLRSMFHEEDFEIEVIENNTVIIYIWNVKKRDVWQAAASFESTKIIVGYGFGNCKSEAKTEAEDVLRMWSFMEQDLSQFEGQ